MKNIFLTSILALAISPAFATGISVGTNSADCDSDTLGTTSGISNLQASWTPNTLNLQWYNGDQQITPTNNTANTCTYDAGITVPQNNITKTGYTFAGWTVRSQTNIDPVCDLYFIKNLLYEKRNSNARVVGYDVVFDYGENMWSFDELYNLTEPGTFAIEYSDGDIAYGTINFWFAPLGDDCWETGECLNHISNSMLDDNATIPDGEVNDFLLNNTQMCAFAPTRSTYYHNYGLYFRMTAYKPKDGVKCRITNSGWRIFDVGASWELSDENKETRYTDGPQTIADNIDDIANIFRSEMGYIEDPNKCFGDFNRCDECIYKGGWKDVNNLR